MHKLIASLTVLSAMSMSAAVHAETPQFPDPSILPPDTTPAPAISPVADQQHQQQYHYHPANHLYLHPACGNHHGTQTITGRTGTTGTYVYPQTGATTTTTTTSNGTSYVYPQTDPAVATTTTSPYTTYRYVQPQTTTSWGGNYGYTQPYTGGMQYYYNPAQYFLPGSMMTPPAPPPMMLPTIPNFAWPNMAMATAMAIT